MSLIVSCEDEETEETASAVGTWTVSSTDQTVTINGVSYVDFFVSTGMSQQSADSAYNEFLEDMALTGTLQLKDDGTYIATFNGDPADTGTYFLSEDKSKITIEPGGDDDAMVFEIITLTKTSFVVKRVDEDLEDMDGDDVKDTMIVTSTMSFTK